MRTRTLAGTEVYPIGLGCMNLSHAYGPRPSEEDAILLLHEAVDLGVTHFDTAALYGFGKNEKLVGKALKPYRNRIHLASKCGMTGVNGQREIDGRPETLKRTVDEALTSLQTDVIDLYYLHRRDFNVPIEESVGAMADMVQAGKIKAIGLSEVSSETLRRAHAEYPIAALQTEYSLWTRNPEISLLDTCRELGVALVAFSPLARGFLTGVVRSLDVLPEKDIRRNMPRFQGENFEANLKLLDRFEAFARTTEYSLAELCLAWLLKRGDHIIPIPGTTSGAHLRENVRAARVELADDVSQQLDELINDRVIAGFRYPPGTQEEIDTELWDWEQ